MVCHFFFQEKKDRRDEAYSQLKVSSERRESIFSLPGNDEYLNYKTKGNKESNPLTRRLSSASPLQESANNNLYSATRVHVITDSKQAPVKKQQHLQQAFRGHSPTTMEKNDNYFPNSPQSLNRLHASQEIIETRSSERIHHEQPEPLPSKQVPPYDGKSCREHQKKNDTPVQDLAGSVSNVNFFLSRINPIK